MVGKIETPPDIVLEQLIYILDPQDLHHLSLTCKTLHSIYSNTLIWKSKTILDFGNLFHVYRLVTTCTKLTLDPFLKETFQIEPMDWCRYYITKNADINDKENDEILIYDANNEYTTAYNQLQSFQREKDIVVMNQVAAKMIRILDVFPAHAGCYYILGFILYVLNQLEEAIILLRMGQKVDNSFGAITELILQIQRISKTSHGKPYNPPLLVNNNTLSALLASTLLKIFSRLDQDKDDALNIRELDDFIYHTNGSHLPIMFLQKMAQRFGSDAHGWLTRNGFLAFYLEQTLDDPSKTRNDIGVYGFDPLSLESIDRM